MRFLYFVFVVSLFALSGCNGDSKTTHKSKADTVKIFPGPQGKDASSGLAHEGTTLLISVVSKYYDLKNALVITDAGKADSAAKQLVVMVGIFQRYLHTDTTLHRELSLYLDTVVAQAGMISVIKDKDCENQRIFFGHISSAVYGLIKKAGLKNAGIFHEYCPMAFNDKGATWLSDEADIKNPYYGKKMLECGEVTDSL